MEFQKIIFRTYHAMCVFVFPLLTSSSTCMYMLSGCELISHSDDMLIILKSNISTSMDFDICIFAGKIT